MSETKKRSRAPRKPQPDVTRRLTPDDHDAIRARAYELYLARGGEPGREMEDWARAEEELTRSHVLGQEEVS
jgi:hypothetical protein